MRVALIAALLVLTVATVPATAQNRLTDRVMASAVIGPNFGGDVTGVTTVGMVGLKLHNWATLGAEFGALSQKPFDSASPNKSVIGRYLNGAVRLDYPYYQKVVPYFTAGMGRYTVPSDGGHFETNLGVGVNYRISRWFGIGAEDRTYFVAAGSTSAPVGVRPVNRFTVGVTLATR